MKVLFDHQIFLLQKYGGISRYFISLLKEIEAYGVTPYVFSPLSVNHYLNSSSIKNDYTICLPSLPPQCIRPLISTLDIILNLYSPDLIHRTYFYSNQKLSFFARSKPLQVLTVYDLIDEIFFANSKKHARILAAKKKSIIESDHIIAISENTKADLLAYYKIPEQKVSVSYLASNNFDSLSTSSFQDLLLPPEYFLFVGNRGLYKNFHFLVKSLYTSSQLKNNVSLIAFGGGSLSASELTLLHPLIQKSRFKHFEGDDNLLKFLYERALALVYPSVYEGFGLPPLEAMSLGCPVICSNSSSLPEVVGDAALLFNPDDQDQLVSMLEFIYSSSTTRTNLISKGYQRSQLFSWSNTAASTSSIYRKLL